MAEAALSKQIQRILQKKHIPLIYLRDCTDDIYSFSQALSNAVDNSEFGPFVDKHSPEELRESGAKVFLSRDKMAGVAVWPDGNIRAVFKNQKSKNRVAIAELVLAAISAGGDRLDCFQGFLSTAYAAFGFIPVARVRFDPAFAPENWQIKFGTPDIIFWKHNGDPPEVVAEKLESYKSYSYAEFADLPCFKSYDEAYEYRDSKMTGKL